MLTDCSLFNLLMYNNEHMFHVVKVIQNFHSWSSEFAVFLLSVLHATDVLGTGPNNYGLSPVFKGTVAIPTSSKHALVQLLQSILHWVQLSHLSWSSEFPKF